MTALMSIAQYLRRLRIGWIGGLGPKMADRQRWMQVAATTPEDVSQSAYRPVDWFLDGAEALGDAALSLRFKHRWVI